MCGEVKVSEDEGLDRYRVLVVGSNGAGKSSIIKHLIQDEAKSKSNETHFKVFKIKNKKILVEFYERFYSTLDRTQKQLFLAKCNLVLIVIDLSQRRWANALDETIKKINEFILLRDFDKFRRILRNNEREKKIFDDWLKFNGILVLNKKEIKNKDFPFTNEQIIDQLESSYQPKDFIFTSIKTGENLRNLSKQIIKILLSDLNQEYEKYIGYALEEDFFEIHLRAIYSLGKNHVTKYYEKLVDLAFNHKEQLVRNAAIWSLGELNNKDIIEELLRKYRSHPHGWDEEKYEMMIALLKLGESSFSPFKAEQLLKKEYVLTRQKEMLRLRLKERGIYFTPKKGARIFVAFVEDDIRKVNNLYMKLKNAQHEPWMYTKDGLGGEKWRQEIPQRIGNSDYVIACLSSKSVNKEGYFQKELKIAIDEYEEKPKDTIYLILIRLDDCKVPDILVGTTRLTDLTWIDYYKKNGFEKILKVIEK